MKFREYQIKMLRARPPKKLIFSNGYEYVTYILENDKYIPYIKNEKLNVTWSIEQTYSEEDKYDSFVKESLKVLFEEELEEIINEKTS